MRTIPAFSMGLAAVLMFAAAGCESKDVVVKPGTTPAHEEHHHGPNDGELIELDNEEYHAELLQVPDGDTVTVFILDKEAKNAVPTTAEAVVIRMTLEDKPTEFLLTPNPITGEPAGSSSRFESKEEKLRAALVHQTAKRELEVKIGDKPYKGEFKYYEPHAHGHAHEEEGHDHKEGEHHEEGKDANPKN